MAALKGALPAIVGAANAAGGDAYQVDRSLRFTSGDSTYLNRAQAAGNRRTFTFSFWIKKSDSQGEWPCIIGADSNANRRAHLRWRNDYLQCYFIESGSTALNLEPTRIFRDSSAWIHVVLGIDTTQSTAADRAKLYINGELQDTFTYSTYPSQDLQLPINDSAATAVIGRRNYDGSQYISSYLAEINFVDGTQLAASDFGETNSDNVWVPKAYGGAYGTNGYYLKFDDKSSLSALGTDSSGNGNNFTPYNFIHEYSVLGKPVGGNYDSEASTYSTSGTISQETGQTLPYTATHYDGNVLRSDPAVATGGVKIVTTNPAYQEFFMSAWIKFDSLADKQMGVDLSGGYIYWEMLSSGKIKIRHTGGSGVESGSVVLSNNTWHHCALSRSGNTLYGFVDGVVAVSTTSGVPSGGDSIAANENWWFFFNPYETGFRMLDVCIFAGQGRSTNFTAPTGPLIGSNGSITNPASLPDTYRVYASPMIGFGDIYDVDSVLDTPTNYAADSGNNGGNYATYDAQARVYSTNGGVGQSGSYSNGNLISTGQGVWSFGMSSIAIPSSGKWYCEMKGQGQVHGGIACFPQVLDQVVRNSATSNSVDYSSTGTITRHIAGGSSSAVTSGLSNWNNGATLGVAVNADDGEIKFYVDGSLQYTYSLPAALVTVLNEGRMHFMSDVYYGSDSIGVNFGQQGFLYTPPTDHIALCTQNLPDTGVADGSTAMGVALYTGNDTARSITGLNMAPDVVWIKKRSGSGNHSLADTVRGVTKNLVPNDTQAEGTEPSYVTAFNSDGFSLGASSIVNNNGDTYVSWNWDAGTSTVSNTDGLISSQVRANQTNGFSIVSYTGNGSIAQTVGHGLNAAPKFIIAKSRDTSIRWPVFHITVGGGNALFLNAVDTPGGGTGIWGNTNPASSVFTIANDGEINKSGDDYIAYCFAPITGFSSFGSYEGNGGSNGPFVYTGFEPELVMYRNIDAAAGWQVYDSTRSLYNVADERLQWNNLAQEDTTAAVDILSNGFKLRSTHLRSNAAGYTYVYAAWAKTPLNFSRSR